MQKREALEEITKAVGINYAVTHPQVPVACISVNSYLKPSVKEIGMKVV